jgi:hypothetical protein
MNTLTENVLTKYTKIKRNDKYFIVTLDLKNSPKDYKKLEEAMHSWGFNKFDKSKEEKPLPDNTYMGCFKADTVEDVYDVIKINLKERKDLNIDNFFVGELNDWIVSFDEGNNKKP